VTMTYSLRHLVWLGAALLVAACDPGGADGAPAKSGRFVGDQVSFQLAAGEVSAFRLAGIECRIAHPLNAAVALCLVRAPGLPSGAFAVADGQFAADLEGVTVAGTIGAAGAAGTWRFEAACPDGQACVAEGPWTASLTVTPPPDLDTSTGRDVPSDVDAGPLGGSDTSVGPAPDLVVPPPTVPANATTAQREAANLLAEIRAAVGLDMPEQIEGVNAAAQAHADYYVTHADKYAASNLSSHSENPAWAEGFTGESPGDRMKAQGVSPGAWSEVMAFSGSPAGALDGWMETLYHREPLVSPNLVRWGFGIASSGKARTEVIDTINGATEQSGPALWPVPGSTGVPRSWHGFETPQPPLPAGESYPSGPIVTVTFERSVALKLTEARLVGPSGEPVSAQVQTPDNDPDLGSTWALYAYDPLDAKTSYSVSFTGTVDGAAQTFAWSFKTL
jgi:hypothetical protein